MMGRPTFMDRLASRQLAVEICPSQYPPQAAIPFYGIQENSAMCSLVAGAAFILYLFSVRSSGYFSFFINDILMDLFPLALRIKSYLMVLASNVPFSPYNLKDQG